MAHKAQLFYCKDDRRYLKKSCDPIGSEFTINLIEPTNVKEPTLYFSRNIEVMKANYIFIEDFGRYYFFKKPPTFDGERFIIECRVDVLMSFAPEIENAIVCIERASNNANFYIDDSEVRLNNYTSYEILDFNPIDSLHFSDDTSQMVMVCSGSL